MDLSIVNVSLPGRVSWFLKMSRHQRVFKSPFFALQGHHIERKNWRILGAIYCLFLAFRTWILIIFITPHHVQAILVQDWHFVIFCLLKSDASHVEKAPTYQSSYQIYETSWNHSSNHPCFFLKKFGDPKSWDFRETMYVWNAVYIYIYTYIYSSIYV